MCVVCLCVCGVCLCACVCVRACVCACACVCTQKIMNRIEYGRRKIHKGFWLQKPEGKGTVGRQVNMVNANTINTASRSSVTPTCFGIKFCYLWGVLTPNLELASLVFLGR